MKDKINIDNEKKNVKHVIKELKQMMKDMQFSQAQLMKTMELNDERLIADHAKDMRTIYIKLLAIEEKRDEELEIMKVNHFNQMTTMQNYQITMEANHKEEMSSIKINRDKVIKDVRASQMALQNKLQVMEVTQYNQTIIFQNMMDTMEENHAREINATKDEHSNKMNAIRRKQNILQNKLQIMEKSQVQKLQPRPKDPKHEPQSSQKKPSSFYEEVIDSIEKWLNEDDPFKKEIDKNQVDACKVDPLVMTDQVHENKEEQVTKVLDVPNFPYACCLNQIESCMLIASTSTTYPAECKCKK